MAEIPKLYYKTCRENANLTQEEACYHLNISDVTTLSKYENGRLNVDQAMVKQMSLLYRNRRLPIWHIRYTNPDLAEFIPDPLELNNDYEFVMENEYAADEMQELFLKFKGFLKDGSFDEIEKAAINSKVPELERIINKLISIVHYIKKKISA